MRQLPRRGGASGGAWDATTVTRRIALALLLSPALLAAQGMRISGVTSAQFVELRPLLIDSAGVQSSGALVHAAPFIQDLTLTAWGLGEGLSVHANARVLTQLAGDGLVYPGANDHVQLLDAYAELARSSWRARLGRQWVGGGLGAYDFDGASGLIRRGEFSAEGWGGGAPPARNSPRWTTSRRARTATSLAAAYVRGWERSPRRRLPTSASWWRITAAYTPSVPRSTRLRARTEQQWISRRPTTSPR